MTDYAVGIDLGTTHCALASARFDAAEPRPTVFKVPQLVARETVEARALLPSFVYFAHESEGPLALPWDSERRFAVGEYARSRAAEAPNRVIASAKSWLSYAAIDRRSGNLPLFAPEDIEKISPVEAAFRYLDHLAEAWQANGPESGRSALAEQDAVVTVPASFDAAARDLTVEAAYAAGMENVTLLEEPQAALYAWIEAHTAWQKHLSIGDVILVIDIGGGTTDFSAMIALERDGMLDLSRVAVGDHILLGGDNMDLTLSHLVMNKLKAQGKTLDRFQMTALTHACRQAKEQLFASSKLDSIPVAIAGRGSDLFSSTLRSELTRGEVEKVILEGFFPRVEVDAHPRVREKAGLSELGLPYASDPAISKHLAAFLTRQARALAEVEGFSGMATSTLLRPTKLLFNGGVVKASALRERLIATINDWLRAEGAPPAQALPGEDPDLAVARGAAYYGLVRRGRGVRIRGGTARAYYVGIESPMPAVPGIEPPVIAVCVAPFGMEEGTDATLPEQTVMVVVGEPVKFRFFGSSTRRSDQAGTKLETWEDNELSELSPIEITLPAEGRKHGELVPVKLSASLTAVGTLQLVAVPLQPLKAGESWQVELGVRSDAEAAAR